MSIEFTSSVPTRNNKATFEVVNPYRLLKSYDEILDFDRANCGQGAKKELKPLVFRREDKEDPYSHRIRPIGRSFRTGRSRHGLDLIR